MKTLKNELKSIFTEHWKYMALVAACKLNLFDKIHEGYNTISKLCEHGWSEKGISFLMSFLVHDNYLTEERKSFQLLPKGDLLREQNKDGLFYACLNWESEHLDAWRNLDHAIITGDSSFEHQFQRSFFDYLELETDKRNSYHKAMYQYAIDDYEMLPDTIDFSSFSSLMDVGGGYGAALSHIKKKHSNIDCILFDLPEVVNNVTDESIRTIPGDFFSNIPMKVDALLLTRVVHDWEDEKAKLILQNCLEALHDGGTLFLIENCTDLVQGDFSLLSLNMIAMCGSHERTSEDFIQLGKSANFHFDHLKKLNDLQTILIFKK